jgi:hypothetical protein
VTGYSWRLEDAHGREMRRAGSFSSRQDAEDWMTLQWAALLAEGAERASLMSSEECVYTMGLDSG